MLNNYVFVSRQELHKQKTIKLRYEVYVTLFSSKYEEFGKQGLNFSAIKESEE
jgi:hypothetical protein